LRNIFGIQREEVKGSFRKLHIEELYDLYSSLHLKDMKCKKRGM
jgi:hypothetical protein